MRTTRSLQGLGLLVGMAAASTAWGCLDVDTPLAATVRFTSSTSAEVILSGFVAKAAGLNNGDECAAGLGHSGALITAVTSLVAVDADIPPQPLVAFAYAANATTTSDLTTLAPASVWEGFDTTLSGSVTAGTVVDLAFTVTVPNGTTYSDLQNELAANGFVVSDDASGGALAGTTQNFEGITALTELPDCYNDVLDGGEVCDGASNLGCLANELCVQCSQCVVPDPANLCKSVTLKSTSLHDRATLKCYANTAKLGQPVDPACLTSAAPDLALFWLKLNATYMGNPAGCPFFPTYPSDTVIGSQIATFDGDIAALLPLGTTTDAWKCAAKKFKAAALLQVNMLKCYVKALRTNSSVDPVCLSKASLKFTTLFARAEAPALCDALNTGNDVAVANRVDQFVTYLLGAIPPP